jgi:bacillithiol system protein YtxJ
MPHAFWSSDADAAAFLDGRGTGFIFKHSSQCSLSALIRPVVMQFLETHPDVPCFEIGVIEYRPASNLVAQRLKVTRQSPQAILVKDGKAVWNDSHLRITADALRVAWAEHAS